jgi:hypothetical protein
MADFICAWFAPEREILLVDTRSQPSDDARGWRIVAGTTPGSVHQGQRPQAPNTTLCAWPPFQPLDLPLLIGPSDLSDVHIFDFSPSSSSSHTIAAKTEFSLDSSLTLAQAQAWWVLPCQDFDQAWKNGMFGQPIRIGRHALNLEEGSASTSAIIGHAREIAPATALAAEYLISPMTEGRVGPAVLDQYVPSTQGPLVDVVLEPRLDGTSQPLIKLYAPPGSAIDDVVGSLRCFIVRRNAAAFDLPDLAHSWIPPQGAARLPDSVLISFPVPIFHGDVIGLMGRGRIFTLASHLTGDVSVPIESWGSWNVLLLVRREDNFSSAVEDPVLVASGLLERVQAAAGSLVTETTTDRLLLSARRQLESVLKRIGIATSYLLDPNLGARARAELADMLSGARTTHLEHLSFAVAAPSRMRRLLVERQPVDHPWRQLARPLDEEVLIECIADIADIDAGGGHIISPVVREVLNHPLAIQAVLNVITRPGAITHLAAELVAAPASTSPP